VSELPPFGTVIRAMPIYSKTENNHKIVTRCENHKKSKEFECNFATNANEQHYYLSHFVRCDHPDAVYVQENPTLRESVSIPFEKPPSKFLFSMIIEIIKHIIY
jgi:tumor protein p73